MAVLEKIRSVQWLLFLALILLGIGMLSFLVPYDAIMSLLGQGQNRAVAEVNGVSISSQEFQAALQQRGSLFDYQNNQSLENEVWNDMLEENLLADDYNALGLTVTQEEFDEIRFGENISPYIKQTFYGGQVTDEKRDEWRKTFSGMYNGETQGARIQYEGYANVITAKRLRERFNTLVIKGMYANTLDAKYDFLSGEEKVSIGYVFKKFNDIPDSVVTVSESDVRAYYNKHKSDKKYAQTKGRSLEYIKIPVESSAADISAISESLKSLKAEWIAALPNDTVLVKANSLSGRYISETLREDANNTPSQIEILAADVGSIVGPYDENGTSKMVRLVEMKSVADSTAKVRHILLKFVNKGTDEEIATLTAKADSLKRAYKKGADFEDLVTRFSEDPGSVAKGGVYEYFPKGQMVPPFEEFSFNMPIGSIAAVETSYGIHLVEVLDQRWSVQEAQLAVITKTIEPSIATKKAAYGEASDFSINFNTLESFRSAADTMGDAVVESNSIAPNAQSLAGGLRNAGEIVSWSFDSSTKKGEVSNPILVDGNYVIAVVTKIMAAGVPPFDNVEDEMRAEVVKEAKADMYVELMKKGENLDAVAADASLTVKTASNITLKSATISGSGSGPEPKVAGLAFAIPKDNMSLPIVGENGIWVIAPSTDVITTDVPENLFEQQDAATSRLRGGAPVKMFNAMKEGADVEDQRN
jgi:peptidyl-prolyl cis-trans isomerase D